MTAPQTVEIPSGYVAITTYGMLQAQTSFNLLEAARFNDKNGLTAVEYEQIPSGLVEKARNEACRRTLSKGHGWMLFIDGDSIFAPDAILALVRSGFHDVPQADIIGAYVPLRGEMALPTIDTGTGTWESWFPNSGVPEVIRTGAAFLLVKRHVLERMPDPWFRMRVPARPLDFMREVDNYARMKFDGKNPFTELPDRQWERLEQCAMADPSAVREQFVPAEVGEDSGFCDRAKSYGFRIFVNTHIQIGHLDQTVRTSADHKQAMERVRVNEQLLSGLETAWHG